VSNNSSIAGMGSGGMKYIPDFIEVRSGIRILIGEEFNYLFIIFQNKESKRQISSVE
jgi:hypothetical protein